MLQLSKLFLQSKLDSTFLTSGSGNRPGIPATEVEQNITATNQKEGKATREQFRDEGE